MVRAQPAWRRFGRQIAVLASLVLTILAGGAALILAQGVDRQLAEVVDTYEVRAIARELSIALVEAESSQRGYLLTLDDDYLAPFERAGAAVAAQLAALRAATADDPDRAEQMRLILAEVGRKQAEMQASVTLASSNREEQAQSLMLTGSGTRMMEDVREAISRFVAEEDQRLIARNAEMSASRLALTIAILAALAGAAVLAYVLLHRTQRQVSALWQRQSLLMSENELLEEHVRERTEALEQARAHAERERERVEALLQDTNHRIGNSLATVSSLLGMQLMRARSEEVRRALEAARDRVQAIASGHRRLRLGADLETVRADEFLSAVLEDLATTRSEALPVELVGDFGRFDISARDATTLGIILGELVTNALKHAFPNGRSGTVTARLRRAEDEIRLEVEDDGRGMPEGRAGEAESGLGSVIIAQLARQFEGETRHFPRSGGGTHVVVALPGLKTQAPAQAARQAAMPEAGTAAAAHR